MLFSMQTFAFAELNQDSAKALLGRTLPDGGGDTFYNMAATPGATARAWIEVDGSFLDGGGTASTPSFRSDAAGVQVGADATVAGDLRLGVALGYDKSWLSDSLGSSGTEELFRASLYGSQPLGPIGISAVLSWAHGWDDTTRATGVGAAVAARGTDDFTGAVEASAPFVLSMAKVTPAAGIIVTHLSGPSFVETDNVSSAFAVDGQGDAKTFVTPFVDLGVSHAFQSGGVTWTPDVVVGYRYDQAAAGSAFVLTSVDGTGFGPYRVGLNNNAVTYGASLTAHAHGWTLFIKYRAAASSNWTDQDVAAGLRLAF
jgi:uncharacterized protein with beta-barrel porin domain